MSELEQANSLSLQPKKTSVWMEGTLFETKDYAIPSKNIDILDDIPTIPDYDELQDLLEKDVSKMNKLSMEEATSALTEITGSKGIESDIDAALEVLRQHLPCVESDNCDSVWTVSSLLTHMLDEEKGNT